MDIYVYEYKSKKNILKMQDVKRKIIRSSLPYSANLSGKITIAIGKKAIAIVKITLAIVKITIAIVKITLAIGKKRSR
jgi:hypothetical protein